MDFCCHFCHQGSSLSLYWCVNGEVADTDKSVSDTSETSALKSVISGSSQQSSVAAFFLTTQVDGDLLYNIKKNPKESP